MMFGKLSFPRRGAALGIYVVALALLGTAVVAAVSVRTAILIGISLALLFTSDLLVMRRPVHDVEPRPLRRITDLSPDEVDELTRMMSEALRTTQIPDQRRNEGKGDDQP